MELIEYIYDVKVLFFGKNNWDVYSYRAHNAMEAYLMASNEIEAMSKVKDIQIKQVMRFKDFFEESERFGYD